MDDGVDRAALDRMFPDWMTEQRYFNNSDDQRGTTGNEASGVIECRPTLRAVPLALLVTPVVEPLDVCRCS